MKRKSGMETTIDGSFIVGAALRPRKDERTLRSMVGALQNNELKRKMSDWLDGLILPSSLRRTMATIGIQMSVSAGLESAVSSLRFFGRCDMLHCTGISRRLAVSGWLGFREDLLYEELVSD